MSIFIRPSTKRKLYNTFSTGLSLVHILCVFSELIFRFFSSVGCGSLSLWSWNAFSFRKKERIPFNHSFSIRKLTKFIFRLEAPILFPLRFIFDTVSEANCIYFFLLISCHPLSGWRFLFFRSGWLVCFGRVSEQCHCCWHHSPIDRTLCSLDYITLWVTRS